ncbi:MAG TPA: hypothetical protein VFR47_30885 [Anaerolineales bacterium]|nr:hypothetical protein [Anaerolineales bacterium]
MNTLSRAITARFFPNPDSYNALRKHWSDLINSERKHELRAAHHLLYLAVIGKDWRRAFTPPTNQRKLDNGAFLGWRMFCALQTIQLKFKEEELLAPFEGLITSQMLGDLRNLLPTGNPYTYQPADFANGTFPFDSYSEKDNMNIIVPLNKEDTNA